jgi:hypothetical protein
MLSGLRTATRACDVWVQDHCMLVFIALLGLGLPSLGLLLLWKWVQVITLAKQLAPVLTITSITITGLMGALRWFKARRDARVRSTDGLV